MHKFIFALLFFSTTAIADEWTTGDTYRETTYLTFLAIDWAQTRGFLREPQRYSERNPLLGAHPEQSHLDAAIILTGTVHYLFAKTLPEKYRATFQYISIGVEVGAVAHNYSIGISAKF
ncbi:MAG: hypothetical protein WCE58_02235 [Gallionella sp.]